MSIIPCGSLQISPIPGTFNTKAIGKVQLYQQMLMDIYAERAFDSILMIQQGYANDTRLEDIYRFPMPKVLLSKMYGFDYRAKYNSEILVVIIIVHTMDSELMETAAQSLNYVRHVRILMIALDIHNRENFKEILLSLCYKYKMTNFLLHFIYKREQLSPSYDQLQPYPLYHWKEADMDHRINDYFPQHWLNMQQGSIITYADQVIPRSLVFQDEQGNFKLNGYMAKLVMLFAELFNATLKMYKPLIAGEVSHFTIVNKLVDDNLVDIPMTIDISNSDDPKWIQRSYVFEQSQGMLIVPCAQALTLQDLFSVLLNMYFFGSVLICTLVFSLVHSLIDYLSDGLLQPWNFVLSPRVLPGVLGQSFAARNSHWRSLKVVYILLFFAGLNISTQFSATMNTLFTSPPLHRPIETLEDIKNSPLKISVYKTDDQVMGGTLLPIFRSVVVSDNITQFEENRNNFNTSMGYIVTINIWKMLTLKQQYTSQKAFCTFDNLTILRMIPFTIMLQQNSQYKEPLNYLIHRVHEIGLMDAWYASTFSDLLKLKKMSLGYSNPEKGTKALAANDLHWVWMILVIGLAVSGVIFIAELWYHNHYQYSDWDVSSM